MHAVDVDAEHSLEVLRSQIEEGFHLGDAGVGNPVGNSSSPRLVERHLFSNGWKGIHRV